MNVAVPKEDAETTATSGDAEVIVTLDVFRRRLGSLCRLFAGGGGIKVSKTDTTSKKCK